VNAKQDLSRELTEQGLVQKARDEFRAPYLMEVFIATLDRLEAEKCLHLQIRHSFQSWKNDFSKEASCSDLEIQYCVKSLSLLGSASLSSFRPV
jgi:hypothetical protein